MWTNAIKSQDPSWEQSWLLRPLGGGDGAPCSLAYRGAFWAGDFFSVTSMSPYMAYGQRLSWWGSDCPDGTTSLSMIFTFIVYKTVGSYLYRAYKHLWWSESLDRVLFIQRKQWLQDHRRIYILLLSGYKTAPMSSSHQGRWPFIRAVRY